VDEWEQIIRDEWGFMIHSFSVRFLLLLFFLFSSLLLLFYNAVHSGNVEEVKEILRRNPNLDVNWRDNEDDGRTALLHACQNGHDSIVSILLAHPDIDVNLGTDDDETPFFWACRSGSTSCVRLLLQDARVEVNEPDRDGHTPLWPAGRSNHVGTIKWWMASGREMDLGDLDLHNPWMDPDDSDDDDTEALILLERFKRNATRTRSELRMELGINGRSIHISFILQRSSPSFPLKISL